MARGTYHCGNQIIYVLYLVLENPERGGGVRVTRRASALSRDERAMRVELKVPSTLFSTPTLKATIEIVETPGTPPQIDVQAAQSALREALGVDIELHVVPAG